MFALTRVKICTPCSTCTDSVLYWRLANVSTHLLTSCSRSEICLISAESDHPSPLGTLSLTVVESLGLNVFSCSFSSRSLTSLSWVEISFSASESLFRVFSNSWNYVFIPLLQSRVIVVVNTWRTVEFSFFASSRLILKLTSSQSVFFLDLLSNIINIS